MSKVRRRIFEKHMVAIIDGYAEDLGPSWQGPSAYDEYIDDTYGMASIYGETDDLKGGLAFVLSHPNLDTASEFGIQCTISDARIRTVLAHAYAKLWPGEPAPTPSAPVEVVWE